MVTARPRGWYAVALAAASLPPGGIDAQRPAADHGSFGRLPGCYALTLGAWAPQAPAGTLPDRFRIDTVPVPEPGRRWGYLLEPAAPWQRNTVMPPLWRPVSGDSIDLVWSTGISGVRLRLAVRGDTLVGRARTFDDVIDPNEPPDPEAPATAVRVPCDPTRRLSTGGSDSAVRPTFSSVQPDLLALGGSFVNAWADYDGDGDVDLFVGFNGAPNRLYRNERGVLVEVAAAVGVADARATRAAAWGDFDADGDPDLLLGFAPGGGSVLRLYRNDGTRPEGTRFVDVTADAGIARDSGAVRQPAWVDFDGDGDLDLFIAFRDRANALFRNDRSTFRDVAAEVGLADARRSVGAVWFDYDEDGDLDLYLGNMDGDANGLFRNDGTRFVDVAAEARVEWAGRVPRDPAHGTVRPCAADVNGDGRLDLFAANYGKNGLYLNRGGGRFEDVSARWGIDVDARYDSCAFDDVDNDGRVDLYVNGTVTGGVSYPDYLFLNRGDRLEEATPANVRALHADHGVQWADYDGDGDVDLALTGARPDGMHLLLRNSLPPNVAARSLRVRVLDAGGRATRAGSEVRLFDTRTGVPIGSRLVDSGSGYDSQSDMPVHFGLATLDVVDVEVIWPSRGRRVSSWRRGVDPRQWRGRVLVVRTSNR